MSGRSVLIAALLGTAVTAITAAAVLDAPPGIDREAFEAVGAARAGVLTELMHAITWLGSIYVSVPVALLAAVLLRARGLEREALALLAGLVLAIAAVQLLKEVAIERPRPERALVDFTGSSYPSGHAAKAIVYVWIPVLAGVASLAGEGRSRWRDVALAAGIVVALLVGISRVYLGVHFLTDVVGGWAVGVVAFAAATAAVARRA